MRIIIIVELPLLEEPVIETKKLTEENVTLVVGTTEIIT